jgi:hypothetical protein
VHDECIVVGKQKDLDYVYAGKRNYGGKYFYEFGTGDRKYIWLSKTYYTMNIDYVPSYALNNTEYYQSFKDGYTSANKRNRIYDSIVVNETTTSCWWRKDKPSSIKVTRQGHLVAPSWGVAIMTIASAVALFLWAAVTFG